MSDYEIICGILDKRKQPYYHYTQIGQSGTFKIMVVDENRDGGRQVPLLIFDLQTGNFIEASTRWIDP